jgi:hypothetical protein
MAAVRKTETNFFIILSCGLCLYDLGYWKNCRLVPVFPVFYGNRIVLIEFSRYFLYNSGWGRIAECREFN